MIRTDDPIADFLTHDYEEHIKELSRPVCCECDRSITDNVYYDFYGMIYCERCAREHRVVLDE